MSAALLLVQLCIASHGVPDHTHMCQMHWERMATDAHGDPEDFRAELERQREELQVRSQRRWAWHLDRSCRKPRRFDGSWNEPAEDQSVSRRVRCERLLRAADRFMQGRFGAPIP